MAAGAYAGNITHTSLGAAQVDLALTGTVQSEPLAVSETLIHWPFNMDSQDSAALRSPALNGSLPAFSILKSSDGVTVPGITPYSVKFGRAFAPNINGAWGIANGGNGGNLSRIIYDEYTVVAKATHLVRVDSMVITAAFYNTSSNTKLAVLYSKSGFISDSAEVTGGVGPAGALAGTANGQFATPVLLANQTGGPTNTYSFALNGSSGVQLQAGETLTVRFYYSCGSTSTGRYAMVKNIMAKGVTEELLPLKLASFTAFPKQSGVATNWKVTYEAGISHYEVERSEDGMAFVAIGRVEAKNSSGAFEYAFTDAKPIAGVSFYRLKMQELDGKISYSRSVKVKVATAGEVLLYPNPAKNEFSISLPAGVKRANYSVVDAAGRKLQAVNISVGAGLQSINVTGLPAGIYWLVIDFDGKRQIMTFRKD
jgi:Secretion system C-terminal sorting domain